MEALIPETVAGWVQAGLGVVATAYFTKAAQKMADKDFEDFGITDLFRMAIDSHKVVRENREAHGECGHP